MPPFLRGKQQLEAGELIVTHRIPTLRIHVEHCMEQIKKLSYILSCVACILPKDSYTDVFCLRCLNQLLLPFIMFMIFMYMHLCLRQTELCISTTVHMPLHNRGYIIALSNSSHYSVTVFTMHAIDAIHL